MVDIEDKRLEEQIEDDEDLLNFDLNDFSLDDVDEKISGSESDDIIELVNLVEEGEKVKGSADKEVGKLLRDGQAIKEELIGVSEGRMEALVSRVVQEVVERVVEGTMAKAAEKFSTKAIDALQQSLETTSETMAKAVEKFSTEAIGALKQGLETSAEGTMTAAEKFSTKAIDTLQQSLETSAEGTMAAEEKIITETIDVLKQSLETSAK